MHSQLFSSSPCLSLLCFLLVFLLKIQSSSSNPDFCRAQFQCGDITAGYPFWGRHREEACGHPELKLDCEGDPGHHLTTMMISDVKYRVLDINSTSHALKMAILMSQQSINRACLEFPNSNTTFNSELFNYSGAYENVTLNYGCPPSELGEGCRVYSVQYEDDFILADGATYEPGICHVNATVPVPKRLLHTTKANWSVWDEILQQGFELKWKTGGMACEDCTNSKEKCGSETICYCPDTTKPFFDGPCPAGEGSFHNTMRKIAIGTAAGGIGILIIFISILFIWTSFQNKKAKNHQIVEAFVRNFESSAPKRYSYSDVKRMTKSFSNRLGQGGYGDVYRGTLPDGRLVAVKFLKESKGNGEEFMNEVASISKTSHVNIVTLLGFCYEWKKQALIYEFVPNGSLDKFLYDEQPSSTNRNLEWKTMYQIAVGIARGLEYLHRGCNTRIVHFDIKPHNILLDEDFCPKISDFGLAKLCKQKESIISMLGARGTVGYIAPEVFCRTFGEVSYKSDIYSYGMMVLEMIGARKNIDTRVSHTSDIYFPNWIYKQLEPSKDFEFHGVVTEAENQKAKKMIVVSMWCIQTIPSDRPSMGKVLEMLEGSLESLQVPPKPSLSVPARSPKHSIPSSSFATSTSSYKPASQEEEVCIDLSDK